MKKAIFITGTGTDVGKTYVAALLVKKMLQENMNTGYYKAAISGANSIYESDAGYVNKIANINQKEDSLLSYLYKTPVSPHLAAKLEGNPLEKSKILSDYENVSKNYDYIVMEGSGGIICPIRWDEYNHYLLEDIIKWLNLSVLVVADAKLGSINSSVLTIEYLKQKYIPIKGIFINNFTNSIMENDNCHMIEELTGIKILSKITPNADDIEISKIDLETIFQN